MGEKTMNIDMELNDFYRFRPNDSFRPGVKTDKFVNATGWKPKISFDKTLKDLLDYWRDKISVSR